GQVLRILLQAVLQRQDELTPEQRGEARIRQTRALLFSGDAAAAQRSLAAWTSWPPHPRDDLLQDLADTYVRLDAFARAVEVRRLRPRQAAPGSPPWFEARYGLALAHYRSGQSRLARQLIDATAILHPDLGGGDLRGRFERLRQRLDPD